MSTGVRPMVARALDEIGAAVDGLGDLDTGDYGDGAADMVELLFPLLERTRAELGDPAVRARWEAETAEFWAEADRRTPAYVDGAETVARAFLRLCQALRGAPAE